MISFIWEPGLVLPAGTGGSENYTIGHVRELNRRGVKAQVVTIGVGLKDGRDEFTDIPFTSLDTIAEVSDLPGIVVFVTAFPVVRTRHPAYQILHIPPPLRNPERHRAKIQARDRTLIATSRFAAGLWAEFLDVDIATISVVYPFAEPCFSRQGRRRRDDRREIKVLYAGRLSPEKGIYTLLATLHNDLIVTDDRLRFTVTTAGADKPQGRIIKRLLSQHPEISLVPARKSPSAVADLMADHDIIVMPSTSQYWHETFGIVSIEAQHTGCRVVASNCGGLPETDCGGLVLVASDNPEALAQGIHEAIAQGPLSARERRSAGLRFTVGQSVDDLLGVLRRPNVPTPAEVLNELETMALVASEPRVSPIELIA